MTVSGETNKALNRNEALATNLIKIVEALPVKGNIHESLNNLRLSIQGLRTPRIIVIGRCKSGKSSLINAICGLKVATVSHTKPETGEAEWKQYYHDGADLLRILDTRGFQEAEDPRKADSAKTPLQSIMQAVGKECPDVILLLCKATEVQSASQEDINICEAILGEIKKKYRRELPVIGVLTKCDELAPPGIFLPTDNERKNRHIQEQVKSFYAHLRKREKLGQHIKTVVPTVAYAEYEEGENGLVLPDGDRRWNIAELVETMIEYTPREIRGSLARMAHIKKFQLTVARTIITACDILCGFIATSPIPGSSIPIVAVIQTFMVMYIGWLGGREFSEETLKDFALATGVGVGANLGLFGLADTALKFVPGFGSLISGSAAAIATQGLGDTAIAFFLKET